MENFEERYSKYIAKLKNEIPYVLWKGHNEFEHNFECNFIQGNRFLDIIAILWWICGSLTVGLLENKFIIRLIIFIVWLGIGIWYWLFNSRHTKDISDYFFYKYEYNNIIGDRIKRDEQREIQNLLNEMFEKDNLDFTDLDMYKFKIEDIKKFYDRCLREMKYEQFEEKAS